MLNLVLINEIEEEVRVYPMNHEDEEAPRFLPVLEVTNAVTTTSFSIETSEQAEWLIRRLLEAKTFLIEAEQEPKGGAN